MGSRGEHQRQWESWNNMAPQEQLPPCVGHNSNINSNSRLNDDASNRVFFSYNSSRAGLVPASKAPPPQTALVAATPAPWASARQIEERRGEPQTPPPLYECV